MRRRRKPMARSLVELQGGAAEGLVGVMSLSERKSRGQRRFPCFRSLLKKLRTSRDAHWTVSCYPS